MDKELLMNIIDRIEASGFTAFEYRDESGTYMRLERTLAANYSAPQTEKAAFNLPSEPEKQEASKTFESTKIIKSPIVGVFYSAPSPDAPPFVSVGQSIEKGDVVCILEAMKVLNEVESEWEGIVEEIYIKNAESVEYGQPILRLR